MKSQAAKELQSPEGCEPVVHGHGTRRNLLAGTAFFMAMALLVLMGWLGYRTLAEAREAANSVARTYRVIEKLQEVLTDLFNAETGQRDFLVTGDRRRLEPYTGAVAKTYRDLAALKLLIEDSRAQKKLAEIEATASERLAVLRDGIETMETRGLRAVQPLILSGRGRELMNLVRSRIDEAVALEMDLLQKMSELQASKTAKANQTLLTGSFLAITLLAAVFTALMRELSRRGRMEKELERRQKELCLALEERTRANDELRQSEQRFASFMLHLPAAAWAKDLMGRYVYGNAEHERIFSMPFSEYSGLRDYEFLPPQTARELRKNDEKVLAEGESLQTIEDLRQADGIEHHFLVSKFPIPGPDGQTAYVAGIALDITERVLAEEALRRSEEKFAKVFHAVPALIGISTLKEGRVIDINETALQLLGYRRDEIIGRTTHEIGFWVEESDRVKALQMLEELRSIRNVEMRFRGKAGQIFTGLFSAEFVDLDGDRCVLTSVKDITERKRAEEEIVRLNADLVARAAELEEANRELETFNYTVAHDLRKPLAVVNGYCQAIKEMCSGRLGEQCTGYLQEAYDGTLRMNRLIDALLEFSKLGRIEPRREKVNISWMAQLVAEELRLAEPERRVTFRIADSIAVEGDENLLKAVLDNLLGNAWKYTGAQEEAIIEFGATEIDGKATCFVRDNGPGFDMADAEKLFLPFQRLEGAEEFRGFGIGLATVERIIRRQGGRVWAEGEPGKGATFYFTL